MLDIAGWLVLAVSLFGLAYLLWFVFYGAQ